MSQHSPTTANHEAVLMHHCPYIFMEILELMFSAEQEIEIWKEKARALCVVVDGPFYSDVYLTPPISAGMVDPLMVHLWTI